MQTHAYGYLGIGPPRGVKSISDISRLLGSMADLPVILRGVLGISFLNRPLSLEHLLRKSFLRLVPLRSEVESLSLALANARTLCANRERLEGSLT